MSHWANQIGTLLFIMKQKTEKIDYFIRDAEAIIEKSRYKENSDEIISRQAYRMSMHLFGHEYDTTPADPKQFKKDAESNDSNESNESLLIGFGDPSESSEETLSGEESQGKVAQSEEEFFFFHDSEEIGNEDEDTDAIEECTNEQSDASSQDTTRKISQTMKRPS